MKNLLSSILSGLIVFVFGLACTISPWQQSTNPTPSTPVPVASQTPASKDENDKLKDKVEELEKKIADQEKEKNQISNRQKVPIIKSSAATARVNSPNDGFLALRTDPSSDYGDRILQIPHGATVKVLGCQGFRVNIGGRSGRWCRVSYDGYTGWVFDGWLIY
ncbi:MAG: SH3 domain-containing protein [Pyrinomonadaceae bacterium]|nr:SH3 domain-containing protein [Pyrinomonadaceae bacterium]